LLDRLNNPKGLHLNAIAGDGDTLFIVGERGLAFRSDDRGATFVSVSPPYEGSYFVQSRWRPPGEVLLAGLRGNVFRSTDREKTWAKVEGSPPVSISAVTATDSHGVLLANHAGQLFVSRVDRSSACPRRPCPPLRRFSP